jgi:DNA-binding MarR family transcriptional regulator
MIVIMDANEFDQFIGALRAAFFALRAISNQLLADLDCTAAERSLLEELDREGPQTVPDLARARAISRQTMQKTVDRLIARRWLVVQPNPRHQRSSLLALAPAGSRIFIEARARERRLLARTALPVSGAELRRITEVLHHLAPAFSSLVAGGARAASHGGRR